MPVTSPWRRHELVEADHPEPADPPRRRRLWRPPLVGIVVVMVAMWGYVLYLALGPGRQPPVDRLDDPAFAEAAEVRCAEAVAAVEHLPPANEPTTAAGRAAILDQANGELAAMVGDLEGFAGLAPPGDQRGRVDEWLTDWRTLLGNRVEYADALREDPGARLLISEKGDTGRHVTGWIDEFANANRMESCATPTDV